MQGYSDIFDQSGTGSPLGVPPAPNWLSLLGGYFPSLNGLLAPPGSVPNNPFGISATPYNPTQPGVPQVPPPVAPPPTGGGVLAPPGMPPMMPPILRGILGTGLGGTRGGGGISGGGFAGGGGFGGSGEAPGGLGY